MKILAVGAHPDDIEFGMCGTMIKLAAEGHDLVGVVLSRGEAGTRGSGEMRAEECKKAASIVGYELEILDFKDTEITDSVENRKIVADVIRKHKPDIVFAPYHTNTSWHKDGVSHQDHTATGALVRHALRIAKFQNVPLQHEAHLVNHLVYYMIPREKKPTFVNDVSAHIDKMLEAMRAHVSQINEEFTERLFIGRRSIGFLIGAKYGEGFLVEDPMKFDARIFS